MSAKPVAPREQALRDVQQALDHYLDQGAHAAAAGFIESLRKAYKQISEQPGSGSLRYAQALGLPGLRVWPLTRYPWLVFYVERVDHIDVWRVLHGHRDVPAWLSLPP